MLKNYFYLFLIIFLVGCTNAMKKNMKLEQNAEIETTETLKKQNPTVKFNYKEHPFYKHIDGIQHERDWMFEVKGYHPSFFSFWKKCKKQKCNE